MTEPRGRHEMTETVGRHERVPADGMLPWHNLAVPASGDGPTLGDRTPPVPWQAFASQTVPMYYQAPPVQPTSAGVILARVVLATGIALAGLILGALLLLTVALIAGPPPADASTPPQTTRPATERVVVAGDSVTLVVEELCPQEDDCTIDYRGKGRWVITRVEH